MDEHRSIGKNISYISRSLGKYIDLKTRHLNLGNATIPFLTYLYEHDGVHQDLLAQDLQFDKSSAARAVASLEKHGYLTKTTDPENRRRNIIKITKKGLGIKHEVHKILKQTTKKLFQGFSKRQIGDYFEYTEQINITTKAMLKEEK